MNDFDKRNVCCWLEVEELEERESSRCPWPVCTCYCCCYCCYCCCCYYCCCYCYCCCYYCCCCFCSSGYGQSQLTAARVMASDQRSENFKFSTPTISSFHLASLVKPFAQSDPNERNHRHFQFEIKPVHKLQAKIEACSGSQLASLP